MSGLSLSARETVEWETPAVLAMSLMEVVTLPPDCKRVQVWSKEKRDTRFCWSALHTCARQGQYSMVAAGCQKTADPCGQREELRCSQARFWNRAFGAINSSLYSFRVIL
jgi:hypothetical protein